MEENKFWGGTFTQNACRYEYIYIFMVKLCLRLYGHQI